MLLTQQLINALVIGTLYAVVASGLALIFGVLKLVNFAHGEAFMMGGFIYFFLATTVGAPPILALLMAIPVLYLFGIAIEWILLRPAYQGKVARPEEYTILITFALALFLQNLALPLFGPYSRQPPAIFSEQITVGGLIIPGDRVAAAVIGFAVIMLLLYFLQRTYWGKGLRAVAQNPHAAAIVGIKLSRMRRFAFGLGITLAGIGGSLLGPVFLVNPTMGTLFAVKSFIIVVLGGMGSIIGSIVGAYLLALVESLGSVYLPDPARALAYKDAYGLLLLILVLLLRPQGLFGVRERRA